MFSFSTIHNFLKFLPQFIFGHLAWDIALIHLPTYLILIYFSFFRNEITEVSWHKELITFVVLVLVDNGHVYTTLWRTKNKRTCQPGELYCVRCRSPKAPAGDMADYVQVSESLGNLVAICPDCEALMNRRVSLAKLGQIRGQLDITMPQLLLS